jgi:tRNA pseudouridine38-40 synthase
MGDTRNIKLILEYDGTAYSGWQKQRRTGVPTVQGMLENAIATLLGEQIETTTAGRTDAGVHAFAQVVNFKTSSDLALTRIPYSLNAILPADIGIKSAEEVPIGFDARRDPQWREYHYYILNRPNKTVFFDRFVLHEGRSLDVLNMNEAISYLVGQHDFTSFFTRRREKDGHKVDVAKLKAINPVRTVFEATCRKSSETVWAGEPVESMITIKIRAHAFLHNMVRIIVGTLIDVGLGRKAPGDVREILSAKNRAHAGQTASAKGLTLVKVKY